MTLDECKEYATRLMEPLRIMYNPKVNEYIVIREFGFKHYHETNGWKPILKCTPTMQFTEENND